jgi:hypothetical protein
MKRILFFSLATVLAAGASQSCYAVARSERQDNNRAIVAAQNSASNRIITGPALQEPTPTNGPRRSAPIAQRSAPMERDEPSLRAIRSREAAAARESGRTRDWDEGGWNRERGWSNIATEVQDELNRRGYDSGLADGILGSQTRKAIAQFQRDSGLPVTGRIDRPLLVALGIG